MLANRPTITLSLIATSTTIDIYYVITPKLMQIENIMVARHGDF